MNVMGIDDLLMAIIIAGLGLSGAYLRAEHMSWRRENDAERQRQAGLRERHLNRLLGKDPEVNLRLSDPATRKPATLASAAKFCSAVLLIVAGLMTLAGCISPRYRMARQDTPPAVPVNLVVARPPLQLQINAVIIYKGPGSWKREALWDEYVITVINQGDQPISIAPPTLIDFASVSLEPGVDPWSLEKKSRTREQRYRSAGVAFARNTLPGVAIVGAGAASIAASGIFSAGAATAATATVVVLPVYYIVVLSVNHVNKSAVKAEFARRRLVWPLTLAPGETRTGSLFFPMVPNPQSLDTEWTSSTASGNLVASLESLKGLHVPSTTRQRPSTSPSLEPAPNSRLN
jgi:hypothetical protein